MAMIRKGAPSRSRGRGRSSRYGAEAALLALGLSACFSAPGYTGPVTDHFDGTRFRNAVAIDAPTPAEVFELGTGAGRRGHWSSWTENRRYPKPPARVGRGDLRVTFVNHATTLVQMDGVNLLTDPIWSERCSPVSFAGPIRVRAPGVAIEDLPRIDAVLVSHNHYDHLDLPSLHVLAERNPGMRIFVGLGNERLLEAEGIPGAVPVDWRQQVELTKDVSLVGWPAQHLSGRGTSDTRATLWLSWVVRGPAGAVYFAGDTATGAHFADAGRVHGPFRLALIPIGAYRPRWFMSRVHIDPPEAVRAAIDLRARTSVAIHFGTFNLAWEGQYEPVRDLKLALERSPVRPRFWVLDFGEGRDVPAP